MQNNRLEIGDEIEVSASNAHHVAKVVSLGKRCGYDVATAHSPVGAIYCFYRKLTEMGIPLPYVYHPGKTFKVKIK